MSRIARGPRALAVFALGIGMAVGAPVAANAADETGAIQGTVTATGGAPVAGANLTVLRDTGGPPSMWEWVQDEPFPTDAAGQFLVDGLEPGRYAVLINPPAGSGLSFEAWDDQPTIDDATPITVVAGATVTIDPELDPVTGFSGRVTRPGGAGVEGVTVSAHRPGTSTWQQEVTDANGDYAFTELRHGEYVVDFRPAAPTDLTREYWQDVHDEDDAQLLVLTAGSPLTGIDAELPVGGSVSGIVTGAGVGPLEGVAVQLYRHLEPFDLWESVYNGGTSTAADGSYEITGIEPGEYALRFAEFDGGWGQQYWDGASGTTEATMLEFGLGTSLTGISPTLQQGATFSGTLLKAPGFEAEVLDGGWVQAERKRADGGWDNVGSVEADASGAFEFTGLAPGAYRFNASGSGAPWAWRFIGGAYVHADADEYTVTGTNVYPGNDLELEIGGRIDIELRDESGSWPDRPVGSRLLWERAPGDWVPYTNGGAYGDLFGSGLGGIAPGNYIVRAFDRDGGAGAYVEQYWDGAPTLESATVIQIEPRDEAEITVYLSKEPFALSPTPTPTIAGTPRVGSTLTATPGTWGPEPVTLAYQWLADGTPIAGATSATFTLTPDQLGDAITVTVTGSKDGYPSVSRTSTPTSLVGTGTLSPAPLPTITGTARVGETLTAVPGTWGPAPVNLGYQWRADGVAISGATSSTLELTAEHLGAAISVAVTGTKPGYTSAIRVSTATDDVEAATLTPTPVPTISGTPALGSTLTADPGSWGPAPVSLSYQWRADGAAIPGATSATLELTAAHVGAAITVAVTGSKPGYSTVTRISAPTEEIAEGTLTPAPTPTISGTAQEGATLTAVSGTWGPAPVSLSYQWRADGAVISGATSSTLELTAAQVGKAITVVVTGSKTGYATVSRTSAATSAVLGVLSPTPTPTISGTPALGSTLTAVPGTWGPAPVTLAYQWHADGVAISGATASTFTPTAAQVGKAITVVVTGTKSGYVTASKTSTATEEVAAGTLTPAPTPTISGTAQEGATLTAVPGTWGPAPVSLSYQWRADGAAISGATASTFTPTAAQVGKAITVVVTGSKDGYATVSRTSAATSPVVAAAPEETTVERLSGQNRYATAVAVAQKFDPADVTRVYLASGAGFADALSAGPVAAHVSAPLLLTAPGSLPPVVKAELERLQPTEVIIVGGTGAVSNAVANQVAALGPAVERIGGGNRYETARNLIRSVFGAGSVETAYLATGANFPDALAAGPAAAHFDGPVVLVPGSAKSVDAATLALLQELGVDRIRIAGGTGVVSTAIQSQLAGIYGASDVTRTSGSGRYQTAVAINAAEFAAAPVAYLATGAGFADALAGAALAGRDGAPLFISTANCIPADVLDALDDLGTSKLVLLGGTGVLSQRVADLASC